MNNMSRELAELGLERRVRSIFRPDTGRAVIVPFDDIVLSDTLAVATGDEGVIDQTAMAPPDAVVAFAGTLERHANSLTHLACILNVTVSWEGYEHTRKKQIHSVQDAVKLNASAVAVHVNARSRHLGEMQTILKDVARDCRELGMPLIGFMYPRGEKSDGSDDNFVALRRDNPAAYADMVAEAVAMGVEAGASAIKTQWTGCGWSFARVLAAARGVPLVMAGGPLRSARDSLQMAYDACEAGASGTSFGRNVFNSGQPIEMVRALRHIVHDGMSVSRAMRYAGVRKTADLPSS